MHRTSPARRLIATALIASTIGCADGGSQPLGAGAQLREGALVSGAVDYSARVTRPDGASLTLTAPGRTFSTRMVGGVAALPDRALPHTSGAFRTQDALLAAMPASTPVLAVAGGGIPIRERTVELTDSLGNRHRLEVSHAGRRLIGLTHTINGELFAEVSRNWSNRGGAWVLESGTSRFYSGGEVVAEIEATSAPAMLATRMDPNGWMRFTTASAGAMLAPEELYASCLGAWAGVVGSSILLAAAITNPATGALAVTGGALIYASQVDRMVEQC